MADDTGFISYLCTNRKVCMVLFVYVADLIKSACLHTICNNFYIFPWMIKTIDSFSCEAQWDITKKRRIEDEVRT